MSRREKLADKAVQIAPLTWPALVGLFWGGLIYDALVSRQLPLWLPITGLIMQITGGICWLTGARQELEKRGIPGMIQLVAAPFGLTFFITWSYFWFIWHPGAAFVSDTLLWIGFTYSLVITVWGLATYRWYARPGWGRQEFWMLSSIAFLPIWQWTVFVTDFCSLGGLRVAIAKGGLAAIFFIGLAWTIRWVENRSHKLQVHRMDHLAAASPSELSRVNPLDAMNRSVAPPLEHQKIWNPMDMDAWYYGRQRQKLKQSLNTFVCYAAIFLVIFLFLMSLTGCDIYELPAGGGEPELKQIVKQVIKIKEIPIVNPLSNLIRPVPPIEEILKNFLEETMHRYEVGQGKGKGAGFAGGTRRGKVRFIRLRYAGGDWDQDLDLNSDLNMLLWYSTHTGQPTAKLPETKSIGQLRSFPKGKSPPLVYMTGERGISISQSETETLREFLVDKHGMIFADNGGSSGWHSQFFILMRRVLPKVTPRAIPIDHPVHSGLSAIPIVAPHGGQTAYGWVVESRIVAYYHPGDIGDAWADGHAGVPRRIWEASYRLGGNIILYAHSEYSKWLQTQQKKD
jgi:hypothetical protein